jgi:hypothetical protein
LNKELKQLSIFNYACPGSKSTLPMIIYAQITSSQERIVIILLRKLLWNIFLYLLFYNYLCSNHFVSREICNSSFNTKDSLKKSWTSQLKKSSFSFAYNLDGKKCRKVHFGLYFLHFNYKQKSNFHMRYLVFTPAYCGWVLICPL